MIGSAFPPATLILRARSRATLKKPFWSRILRGMLGRRKPHAGFTLIEVLVVVLIIGILAAFAVPEYFKVVERGRAAEAIAYFGDLQAAQERYLQRHGVYFVGIPQYSTFDVVLPGDLKYWDVPGMRTYARPLPAPGGGTVWYWSATITRKASVRTYGQYVITATYWPVNGFRWSCADAVGANGPCWEDLLGDVH